MSDIFATSPSRRSWLSQAVHWALGQWRMFAIVSAAAAFGWGMFATWTTAIEYTNHTEFCITCHVMKDTVFQEYKKFKTFQEPVRRACRMPRLPCPAI